MYFEITDNSHSQVTSIIRTSHKPFISQSKIYSMCVRFFFHSTSSTSLNADIQFYSCPDTVTFLKLSHCYRLIRPVPITHRVTTAGDGNWVIHLFFLYCSLHVLLPVVLVYCAFYLCRLFVPKTHSPFFIQVLVSSITYSTTPQLSFHQRFASCTLAFF